MSTQLDTHTYALLNHGLLHSEVWSLRNVNDAIYSRSNDLPRGRLDDGSLLYVLRNPRTGFVKIGVSSSPASRAQNLEMASGCRFDQIYLSLPFYNAKVAETALHELFQRHREVGEWFAVPFFEPVGVILFLEEARDHEFCVPAGEKLKHLCRMKLSVVRRRIEHSVTYQKTTQ